MSLNGRQPVYMEGTCVACGMHTVVHKDTRLCQSNGCIKKRGENAATR